MKIQECSTLKERQCLYCRKKILPREKCYVSNYGSVACGDNCGKDFKEILEEKEMTQTRLDKFDGCQKSIADFAKQEEGKKKFSTKKRFIYSVPVRNFTAIKDVYKDEKGNRIEEIREF